MWILDGLEVTLVGSMSGVLTEKGTLQLSTAQATAAGSFCLGGAVAGALLFGYLPDRFVSSRASRISTPQSFGYGAPRVHWAGRLIFVPWGPRYARAVRARLALGAVLVLAATGCGGGGSKQAAPAPMTTASAFRGTELTGGAPSPDFALRDQNGTLVRLAALRGKTVLVTFLYTHCPDVCPIIATNLDAAVRRLGSSRARVRVLAVSVDPARDTPAAAREFVRSHALLPQFHFLVGTRRELARVWRSYHIAVQPGPQGTVSHSAYTLLVDARGRQRVLYDAQVKPPAVLHDLRLVGR